MTTKSQLTEQVRLLYHIPEDDPVITPPLLDIIMDNALMSYGEATSWETVETEDLYPIRILAGVDVYTNRAGFYARNTFPIDTPLGPVDKTVLISNNQSMARMLLEQYEEWETRTGSEVICTDVGITDIISGAVIPQSMVSLSVEEPRITTIGSSAAGTIELEWTYSPAADIYSISVYAEIGSGVVLDSYTYNGVKEGLQAKATFKCLPVSKCRITGLDAGSYEVVVVVYSVSKPYAISEVSTVTVA